MRAPGTTSGCSATSSATSRVRSRRSRKRARWRPTTTSRAGRSPSSVGMRVISQARGPNTKGCSSWSCPTSCGRPSRRQSRSCRRSWRSPNPGAILDEMKRLALLFALLTNGAWTFDWAGHVELDAENLKSDDAQKRYDAVNELAKYDIALTEDHLLKMLDDPEDRVRIAAARALGSGGSMKAVDVLNRWLTELDPKLKVEAARALGVIGGQEAT